MPLFFNLLGKYLYILNNKDHYTKNWSFPINDFFSKCVQIRWFLQSNFIEITLQHGCSPVNLLRFFQNSFFWRTSLEGYSWILLYEQTLKWNTCCFEITWTSVTTTSNKTSYFTFFYVSYKIWSKIKNFAFVRTFYKLTLSCNGWILFFYCKSNLFVQFENYLMCQSCNLCFKNKSYVIYCKNKTVS